MPESTLIRRLKIFADLSEDEERRLTDLCSDVRQTPAKQDIICEGERPKHVHLVLRGWAARYKVLPDGARQIVIQTLDQSSEEEKADYGVIKEKIRADLKRYISKQTQKRPLIMPVILEI